MHMHVREHPVNWPDRRSTWGRPCPLSGKPCPLMAPSPAPADYLLLLVDHVVDEEDAVSRAIVPRELLQGHAHVHPLVGLPVTPPLQGPSLHPHRLSHGHPGQ